MLPQVFARTLQINRLRVSLVTAVITVVAVNSALLLSLVGKQGILPVFFITFFSILLPTALLFREIIGNSGNSFRVFEALGASRRTLIIYLVATLSLIGLFGVVLGSILGLTVSYVFQTFLFQTFINSGYEVASSVATLLGYTAVASASGMVVGVTAGVFPVWWRNTKDE